MKRVLILLVALSAAFSVAAQPYPAALTITVTGNKNLKVSVDEKGYLQNNSSTNGNRTTFSATDLDAGQHTLVATRTHPQLNTQERTTSLFYLRSGFDMHIRLQANGSLELIETKTTGTVGTGQPVSDPFFKKLQQSVTRQPAVSGRVKVITNALHQPGNYFTTSQVRELLKLVNSENGRLQLSKSAYAKVTDKNNFSQAFDLLNSRASENALELYVNDFNDENAGINPVSDDAFVSLRNTIQQQPAAAQQVTAITNALADNYFTTYQARQLVQILQSESSRLQLAKLSYHSITDPANFTDMNYLFSSPSYKDQLAVYVADNTNSSPLNPAMSYTNFNSLYQSVEQQWPESSQLQSLTDAFTNTAVFFTSLQARQLIQLLRDENNRLQLAKTAYRSITDRNNFSTLNSLFSSQSAKDQLAAYVRNYFPGNSSMTDSRFTSLYQTILLQWPVSVQVNSITSTFANPDDFFTVAQAKELISIVGAEGTRLQLAKTSFRAITDRDRFTDMNSILSSQVSRDQLAAYVSNYNNGNSTGVAFSEADFKSLHQKISAQFYPNQKMNSLKDAFQISSYFFTSSQARQLIQLVSYESNRLELSKLVYRSITDKDNFNQVYALLNTRASRDELENFVKNYTASTAISTQ